MAFVSFGELLKVAGDVGFSPLPAGTYDVKVHATENRTTGKGKDMIVVKYEVLSGPYAGRKVSNNMTLSPESPMALGFFFREMKAMGLPGEYFQANPSMEKVAADLVGQTCRIEVIIGSYNNEPRNEVKKILPLPDGPVSAPMPAAQPQPVAQPVAQPQPVDAAPTTSQYLAADPNAPELPF